MYGLESVEWPDCTDSNPYSPNAMGLKKNWTNDEDVFLLRQVNGDLPFKAKKGGVMDAWAKLATVVNGASGFTRVVDGKKAQNGFVALLKEHDD